MIRKKTVLYLGILIVILLVIVVVIILKKKNHNYHSEYGDILTYSFGDDDWKSFVSYSEPQEKMAIFSVNRVSDYSGLTVRFNQFLDNNPSYYLNEDYYIAIVFDFELKNRGIAMQIKNYERGSKIKNNRLNVATIGEWDLIVHGIYKGNPFDQIECLEVGRSDLDNYYKEFINVFPSVRRIVTVTTNSIYDEVIKSYALSVGRDIAIEEFTE